MSHRTFFRRALPSSGATTWYRVVGVGAAGILALGVWAFFVHAEARRDALAGAGRSAAVVAQAVARDQERLIDSAQQVLLGLAQRAEILTVNADACARLLTGVTRTVPGYLDIVAVAPSGGVFCAASGKAWLPGNAEAADVRRTVESGGPVVGRPGLDTATRRPTIAITAPAVDDAGVVRAVLVAALDLGALMRPVAETPLPAGAAMLLTDASGLILAHHPDPDRWVGAVLDQRLAVLVAERATGLVAGAGLDGADSLILSEPLLRDAARAADASIVVTLPRRAVFRNADHLFVLQLAGLGLLALLGVAFGVLLLDRVVAQPAEGLLRVIASLNAGDARARMRRGAEGRGVVGRIALSLNALGRRLEEHQETARRLEAELRDARALNVVNTPVSPPEVPMAEPAPVSATPADEAHAGFRESPFENAPNPRFLWLSPNHADALVRLTYALRQRRGCALLTGELGCGKTLLTRAVVQRLDPQRYEVALLTNPQGGRIDLLRQVLYELGVETGETSRAELLHVVHEHMVRTFRRGRETLVIVDEAQEPDDPEWYEELSALLNVQTNERTLVTLMLVGTPELAEKVQRVRHLDRRVSLRCTLSPLSEEQTGRYIAHRLGVAGGDEGLFTPDAVAVVHAVTHGVPRAINDVCDGALLLARLDGLPRIDEHVMRRLLSEAPTAEYASTV
jgi:general secretion pathway protein A